MSGRVAAAALLVAASVAIVAAASPTGSTASLSPKLRSDLAALVSGQSQLDPRIPALVPGYLVGGANSGDFGSFVFSLDEVR